MTRKELLKLPVCDYDEKIPLLDELYIVPTMKKHDSGYRIMEIIGVRYERNEKLKSHLKLTGKPEYAKKIDSICDVCTSNFTSENSTGNYSMDIPSDCNCIRIFTFEDYPNIKVFHNYDTFEFSTIKRTVYR